MTLDHDLFIGLMKIYIEHRLEIEKLSKKYGW